MVEGLQKEERMREVLEWQKGERQIDLTKQFRDMN